jgi:rubredoxin
MVALRTFRLPGDRLRSCGPRKEDAPPGRFVPNIFPAAGTALCYNSPVPKRWECVICGYIHDGEEPPDICPVCDAPKEFFRLLEE